MCSNHLLIAESWFKSHPDSTRPSKISPSSETPSKFTQRCDSNTFELTWEWRLHAKLWLTYHPQAALLDSIKFSAQDNWIETDSMDTNSIVRPVWSTNSSNKSRWMANGLSSELIGHRLSEDRLQFSDAFFWSTQLSNRIPSEVLNSVEVQSLSLDSSGIWLRKDFSVCFLESFFDF